jgi:cysteine desulfurase
VSRHYFDHASTSPPRPEVVAAMRDWLERGEVGDPGRVHSEGRAVRAVVEDAREAFAELLRTRPRQVVLTSGGTEAVNAAVHAATTAIAGAPVVLGDVEHSSVRAASHGRAPVATVPVDRTGTVDPAAVDDVLARLDAAGTPAALVHCQAANHEVGTVQPVVEVIEVAHRHGAWVHVDACAAVGHVPLDLDDAGAELVSVSAHKFGGPAGVGALVVRRGLRVDPFVVGGDQERARRAGMENVLAVVGAGAACRRLAGDEVLHAEARCARAQTDALVAAAERVTGVRLLGERDRRLPHIVCLAIDDVEGEGVVLGLDQLGVAVHSGSSCASESLAPSPVLEAMHEDSGHSLRLSVGWSTTDDDVAAFVRAFPAVVGRLRSLRPGAAPASG